MICTHSILHTNIMSALLNQRKKDDRVLWVQKDGVGNGGVAFWQALPRSGMVFFPAYPAVVLLVGFFSGPSKLPYPKQTKLGAIVEKRSPKQEGRGNSLEPWPGTI